MLFSLYNISKDSIISIMHEYDKRVDLDLESRHSSKAQRANANAYWPLALHLNTWIVNTLTTHKCTQSCRCGWSVSLTVDSQFEFLNYSFLHRKVEKKIVFLQLFSARCHQLSLKYWFWVKLAWLFELCSTLVFEMLRINSTATIVMHLCVGHRPGLIP